MGENKLRENGKEIFILLVNIRLLLLTTPANSNLQKPHWESLWQHFYDRQWHYLFYIKRVKNTWILHSDLHRKVFRTSLSAELLTSSTFIVNCVQDFTTPGSWAWMLNYYPRAPLLYLKVNKICTKKSKFSTKTNLNILFSSHTSGFRHFV